MLEFIKINIVTKVVVICVPIRMFETTKTEIVCMCVVSGNELILAPPQRARFNFLYVYI